MMFPERVDIPRLDQSRLDAVVLLFTLGLSLIYELCFGLVPALQASRPDINEALKEGARSSSVGTRSHLLRNLLVIAETALSLVLLIGAGLMLRSFYRLLRVNPGFNPERVLTAHVPLPKIFMKDSDRAAYCNRMLERVQTIPGVNAVALVVPRPLGDVDANWTFSEEGRPTPPGEQKLVKLRVVSPGISVSWELRFAGAGYSMPRTRPKRLGLRSSTRPWLAAISPMRTPSADESECRAEANIPSGSPS